MTNTYLDKIKTIAHELGMPNGFEQSYKLPMHIETADLISLGNDIYDREQFATTNTKNAWQQMQESAHKDNVSIDIISAFRSVDYQKNIIVRKLGKGEILENIIKVMALPGYSEHHTGRALDLATDDRDPLTESFDQTEAFQWLSKYASNFGFKLSYPAPNNQGIIYEPWHWTFIE